MQTTLPKTGTSAADLAEKIFSSKSPQPQSGAALPIE